MKSSDVLKWGFFGSIGRSAGKDFYAYAKRGLNIDGSYIDTSGVDTSELGKTDSNGTFTYNGFEKTSFIGYICRILGLLIPIPVVAIIMLFKAIKRLAKRQVRFVNLYDCPKYKPDGRTKSGARYVGSETVKFVYFKSYEEAKAGVHIQGKKNNSVARTKFDIYMYLVLSILGLVYSISVLKGCANKNEIKAQAIMRTTNTITHWTDTVYVDDFTEQESFVKYVYPTKKGKLYKDFVMVNQDGIISIYAESSYTLGSSDFAMKLFNNGEGQVVALDDKYEYLFGKDKLAICLPNLGNYEYAYKYILPSEHFNVIEACDSIQVRSKDNVFSINCK